MTNVIVQSYTPLLATQITLNLVGIGLGNGQLSHVYQTNAYVDLAFYRGVIGIEYIRPYNQKLNYYKNLQPIQVIKSMLPRHQWFAILQFFELYWL